MSSAFLLELDTRAPEVELGEATGTTGGEFLRVPYTTNEPIERARLRTSDGRWFVMAVEADELTVQLPADTTQGWAALEIRDEVWNTRLVAQAVLLQGVPLPPTDQPIPVPSVGGLPAAPAPARLRRVSLVGSRSRAVIGASKRSAYSRIGVASYAPRMSTELELGNSVGVRSGCATRTAQRTRSSVATGSSSTRRRRDDEAIVALILGLQS